MKKIIKAFSILILLSCFSIRCGTDDFSFSFPYAVVFDIEAGLNPILDHHHLVSNIPDNLDVFLPDNQTTLEEIREIRPRSARMGAVFANVDFNWIFEVSVEMFSMDDPSFRKEIFYRENIPSNTKGDLDLIPTIVDVKDFLGQGPFGVDIILKQLRGTSPQGIETRLDFNFGAVK